MQKYAPIRCSLAGFALVLGFQSTVVAAPPAADTPTPGTEQPAPVKPDEASPKPAEQAKAKPSEAASTPADPAKTKATAAPAKAAKSAAPSKVPATVVKPAPQQAADAGAKTTPVAQIPAGPAPPNHSLTLQDKTAPWVFSTPQVPAGGESEWVFEAHPEYRARFIQIQPLEVNGTAASKVNWAEQRLRLDVMFARSGLGAVFVQVDVLDGVLFGDNGTFGLTPEVNSGLGIASKQPNNAGWQVGLLPGRDPLSIDSYGPILREIEPIRINYAYGEVLLPFGILRVGRMPTSDAGNLAINDGRSGRNLWGASYYHNASDRILFGTKISEAFMLLADSDHKVDRDRNDGVFLGLVYDILVADDIYKTSEDLEQFAVQLDWKIKHFKAFGADSRFRLTTTMSYRWSESQDNCPEDAVCPYNTSVFAFPTKMELQIGDFYFEGQFTIIEGSTRELSAGFSELNNRPVVEQRLSSQSARLWFEGRIGPVTLLGVWAFSSGDADPRPETPMTIGSWARDTNLGLLLFEHILAFQSARSAAVGIQNLLQLEADSFPLTEIQTDGRVTNANVINPQIFIEPLHGLDIVDHDLRIKLGALFAWTAAPAVDPIQSILAQDGENIDDDLINYHGGKPGNYWGTEIDVGLEYRYKDYFGLILEAGVLFPGDALHDENGEAVMSWMFESRFEFRL